MTIAELYRAEAARCRDRAEKAGTPQGEIRCIVKTKTACDSQWSWKPLKVAPQPLSERPDRTHHWTTGHPTSNIVANNAPSGSEHSDAISPPRWSKISLEEVCRQSNRYPLFPDGPLARVLGEPCDLKFVLMRREDDHFPIMRQMTASPC